MRYKPRMSVRSDAGNEDGGQPGTPYAGDYDMAAGHNNVMEGVSRLVHRVRSLGSKGDDVYEPHTGFGGGGERRFVTEKKRIEVREAKKFGIFIEQRYKMLSPARKFTRALEDILIVLSQVVSWACNAVRRGTNQGGECCQ